MRNDIELVQAAQSGDAEAFRELVNRHEARVYHLGLKMLHSEQDAEDVLQETFINAYRHLDSFRGESEFSTWLYRIATNVTLMRLRSAKPVDSLDDPSGDGVDVEPRELVDWSASPEELLLRSETREQMNAALARLPETLRSVFVLRDIEGFSVDETARILAISVPNVKTRLHRARLSLREHLSPFMAAQGTTAGKEVAR